MITNVSTALAEKNIKLGFRPGSFLSGFRERYDAQDIIIDELAEKFASEIKFYKDSLYPILSEFNREIDSRAPFLRDKTADDVTAEEIRIPYIFKDLTKGNSHKEDYINGASTSSELLFEGFDPMTTTDIRDLFKDNNGSLDHLADILPQYSDDELKKLLLTYGRLIFTSYKAVEINPASEYRDYRNLGVRSNGMFTFKDEIALFYAYICNRLHNPVVSNLTPAAYDEVLKTVKSDVEHMISTIMNHYNNLVNSKTLVVIDPKEPKKVSVISENLEDFLSKATKDAWSAIRGCAPVVGVVDVNLVKVDTLLNLEDRAIEAYNKYNTAMNLVTQDDILKKQRDLYLNVAINVWEAQMTDELKAYSKHPVRDNMVKAVKEYIQSVPSEDVIGLNPAIAINIVAGIFFGETSFLSFIEDTKIDNKLPNFDELTDKDSITVAGIQLLVKHLVTHLSESNRDGNPVVM